MGSEIDKSQQADSQHHASYLDNAVNLVWARDPNATTPQPQDYLKDLIKTVPLFMGGRVAMMGASALGAMDQMHSGDSAATQAVDGLLGAIKGAATQAAFSKIGDWNINPVVKGVTMGMTARTLDLGLSRQTYFDSHGDFSAKSAFTNMATGSMQGFTGDVVGASLGYGALRGMGKLGFGTLQESRLLGSVMSGTVFGASSGMYNEFHRESQQGQFNPLSIAKESFIHAGLGGLAAGPGGFQSALAYRVSDFGPIPPKQSAENLARMHDPIETTAKVPEQAFPGRVWESEGQFWTQGGLRMGDQAVRRYSVTGHTTKLDIPIDFDNALPGIRSMRATAGQPMFGETFNLAHTLRVASARIQNDFSSMRGRYLPEDLITGLDQAPDPRLIESVVAQRQAPPYNFRVGRHTQPNSAMAEKFDDNHFVFYRPPENYSPDEIMLHEWSHIQQKDNKVAYAAFHAALKVEEYGWDHSDYAKKNVAENWSVHSEPLLGANEAAFNRFVENAPVRATVLGRALEDSLAAVPVENRPATYDMLMNRAQYIRQNAEPRARTSLGRTGQHNAAGIVTDFLNGKIDTARAEEILNMDWKYDYYRE